MRASILTLYNAQNFSRVPLLSGCCSVIDFGVERARHTDQSLVEEQLRTCVRPRYFMASRPVLSAPTATGSTVTAPHPRR